MMNKRWLVMIGMVAMACALLAGCGGGAGGGATASGAKGTVSGTAK